MYMKFSYNTNIWFLFLTVIKNKHEDIEKTQIVKFNRVFKQKCDIFV